MFLYYVCVYLGLSNVSAKCKDIVQSNTHIITVDTFLKHIKHSEDGVKFWNLNVNQHNLNLKDRNVQDLMKYVKAAVDDGTEFDKQVHVALFRTGFSDKKTDNAGVFNLAEMVSTSRTSHVVTKDMDEDDAVIVRSDEIKEKSLGDFLGMKTSENVVFGILDGLHRTYALLQYMQENVKDQEAMDKLKNIPLTITYYVLDTKLPEVDGEVTHRKVFLNHMGAHNLEEIFKALSLDIGKNKQKSVDRTLKDLFTMDKGVVGSNKLFYSERALGTRVKQTRTLRGGQTEDVLWLFAYCKKGDMSAVLRKECPDMVELPKLIMKDLLSCNKHFEYARSAFKENMLPDGVKSLISDFDKHYSYFDDYWSTTMKGVIKKLIQMWDHQTLYRKAAKEITFNLATKEHLSPKIYYLLRSIEPAIYCAKYKKALQNFVDLAEREEDGFHDERMLAFAAIAEETADDWCEMLKKSECKSFIDGKKVHFFRIFFNNIMGSVYECFNLLLGKEGVIKSKLAKEHGNKIFKFRKHKTMFSIFKKESYELIQYLHYILYCSETEMLKDLFEDGKGTRFGPAKINPKASTASDGGAVASDGTGECIFSEIRISANFRFSILCFSRCDSQMYGIQGYGEDTSLKCIMLYG